MANYFNTLSLGQKLEQLSKCRFMETSEFQDGVIALNNKNIVLCVTGSIAAYKSVYLASLIVKEGAN